MLNGQELLLAIVKQAIKDYERLNPESLLASAEFFESEGEDFKTAKNFIFYREPIHFGKVALSFEDICNYLEFSPEELRDRLKRF